MPMPREEEDDLFHDVEDVDFADDDADEADEAEKPKKKTAKKKTGVKKKPVKKKVAKKKVAKKAPVVEESDEEEAEDSEEEAVEEKPKKPARRKRRKKIEKDGDEKKGFGDGLFDESEDDAKPAKKEPKAKTEDAGDEAGQPAEASEGDEKSAENADEYGRPEPVANYVVHLYELGRLKRTIEKDFTPEAAEAFATEFNRTSKKASRSAVAGKKDTQPAKEVAEA